MAVLLRLYARVQLLVACSVLAASSDTSFLLITLDDFGFGDASSFDDEARALILVSYLSTSGCTRAICNGVAF